MTRWFKTCENKKQSFWLFLRIVFFYKYHCDLKRVIFGNIDKIRFHLPIPFLTEHAQITLNQSIHQYSIIHTCNQSSNTVLNSLFLSWHWFSNTTKTTQNNRKQFQTCKNWKHKIIKFSQITVQFELLRQTISHDQTCKN